MKTVEMKGGIRDMAVAGLKQTMLFRGLSDDQLRSMTTSAELYQYEPGEAIVRQGESGDSFFLVARGTASVLVRDDNGGDPVEVAQLHSRDGFGEMSLLLDQPRNATVVAGEKMLTLKFPAGTFRQMFSHVPGFSLATCKSMAERLAEVTRQMPLQKTGAELEPPSADVLSTLPMAFVERHRVLPLRIEGKTLVLGCVDDPSPRMISAVRQAASGLELQTVGIPRKFFDKVLRSQANVGDLDAGEDPPSAGPDEPPLLRAPRLDPLLRRMIAEGSSDLHLSAGHKPRWRIDGDLTEIGDTKKLGYRTVHELLAPAMDERARTAFDQTNDADFAYAIPGLARFRVNIFRDHHGVGSVLRSIPSKILTLEQLGLPKAIEELCSHAKGLVLVTGPTGSGKSTTLAAMVDHVNKTRADHIITLEDPVEFVHDSRKCLVNQREMGAHTDSFHAALRAALRQDPDIVLVGELRDVETTMLALEAADTGHLVFATLHTGTAVGSVDRIVDLFPSDQHNQVRSTLSETLRGVVAQTLCKRVGGGRVAAFEILVTSPAIANLIREGKTSQVPSLMQTGKAQGNSLLNNELIKLIDERKVTEDEAVAKAADKRDLRQRLTERALRRG